MHRNERILHDIAMVIAVAGSLALCAQGYAWSRQAAERAALRASRALQFDARTLAEGTFRAPQRPSCPEAWSEAGEGR